MTWVIFLACAATILVIGTLMARAADTIADHTGLGKAFLGSILLAGATSAPELMTTVSSARLGEADLVVGNLLGSNMCNMALLGVVDLFFRRVSLLANMALAQAFAAALAVFLTVSAGAFLMLRLTTQVAGLSVDILLLGGAYFVGIRLLHFTEAGDRVAGHPPFLAPRDEASPQPTAEPLRRRSLRRAGATFAVCTLLILVIVPQIVASADQIARDTGLGATFVGTIMLALVTSLPELTASVTAVRMGSHDLAVGNLFGSNAFNILLLVVGDIFYTRGPLLAAAQPAHALTALLATGLMMVGLMSLVYRGPRVQKLIQADAAIIVILYFGAMLMLYRTVG